MLLHEVEILTDLIEDLPRFEGDLARFMQRLNLQLTGYVVDHVSLRCHKIETAIRWRNGLKRCAELLSEQTINGRTICLFILNEPLKVRDWLIECIELPYPGKTFYPYEGWEHIEVVLPVPPAELHQQALLCLPERASLDADIKIKLSQPRAENEGLENPTLAVTDGIITVKFHPYPIQDIVRSEISITK